MESTESSHRASAHPLLHLQPSHHRLSGDSYYASDNQRLPVFQSCSPKLALIMQFVEVKSRYTEDSILPLTLSQDQPRVLYLPQVKHF